MLWGCRAIKCTSLRKRTGALGYHETSYVGKCMAETIFWSSRWRPKLRNKLLLYIDSLLKVFYLRTLLCVFLFLAKTSAAAWHGVSFDCQIAI